MLGRACHLSDTCSALKELQQPLSSNPTPLYTVYIAVSLTELEGGCWKTSPQRYHVMRLVGEISWQESDQSDNFDRWSKFLEISSTTYIENKQYTEFQPHNLILQQEGCMQVSRDTPVTSYTRPPVSTDSAIKKTDYETATCHFPPDSAIFCQVYRILPSSAITTARILFCSVHILTKQPSQRYIPFLPVFLPSLLTQRLNFITQFMYIA